MPNDYTKLTFDQLADEIAAIWCEVKRRNPIGVNTYTRYFVDVASVLADLYVSESLHATCEAGPEFDAEMKKLAGSRLM